MLGKLFRKSPPAPEVILPPRQEVPVEEVPPCGTLSDRLDSFLTLLPEFLWVCEGKDITDSTPLWISSAAPFNLPQGATIS